MISDFVQPKKAAQSPQPGTQETNTEAEQKTNTKMSFTADDFRTPEETAAEDELMESVTIDEPTSEPPKNDNKPHWLPNKRMLLITAGVIVITSVVGSAFLLTRQDKPVASKPVVTVAKKKLPPKPTTVASNLSGLQVDPAINSRPVVGVMIENSLESRPQSGLSQASVVFEAIAEGGVTRFLALFQDTQPANLGPVRSARPYYVQWAMGFNAAYAHVGGSPEALANIREWGVRDMDQFANGGAFRRITTRYSPHNVYTEVPTLTNLAISKGYTSSTFTPWARKAEAAAKVPTAKTVNIAMSGPRYNSQYIYDPATNTYKRNMAGAPHLDAEDNVQISPKVVIALVMQYGFKSDGLHSDYQTLGSGTAYVFQDGIVTVGAWNKADNATNFSFTDAAGQPLAINPGQAWVSTVSADNKVTYTP